MNDLDAFARFLADPTATAYMAFTPEQRTRAGAKQTLEFVISSYDTSEPVVSFTIADPDTDDYLGSCGLNPLEGEEGLEVYYTVMPEQQNRGLATEAVKSLLAHLFETAEVKRVVAFVDPVNISSVRVAEKLGFIDDGPVERRAQTAQMLHETVSGRRYVLQDYHQPSRGHCH